MKIIHFISSLGNGGAEKLSVELSNSMSKDNEVLLVSFKKLESWMYFPKKLSPRVRLLTLNKEPGLSFRLIRNVIFLLRREKPEIVNLHLDSVFNYFFLILSFFNFLLPSKISFFYTIHNTLISSNKKKFDIITKFNFPKINYICISPLIYQNFSSRYNYKTFHLIENGCAPVLKSHNFDKVKSDVSSLKLNSDTKIILAIGRISPQKNYQLMLEVIKDFEDENLRLIIIGDDILEGKPLLKDLKKITPKIVTYISDVESVADYLCNSDAFFLSSTHEGMPISVIEAMSIGLPIICTPAGGLVDMVIPQKNGFIASNFTTASLSNQLRNFLNSKHSKIEQIKRNNLNDFRDKYSLNKCSNEYLNLYRKIKYEV